MPVRIRLRRVGRKKQPSYRIIVADSHTPRDGAYVDSIGFYNPRRHPAELRLDLDSLDDWLNKGAQPTETVASLIRKARRGGDAKVAFLKEDERPPVTAAVAESVSAASEAVSAPAPEGATATAPLATETSAAEEAAVEEAASAAEPEASAPTRKAPKAGSKGSGEAKTSAAPRAESAPAPEEAEAEEPAAEGGGAESGEKSAE